MTELINGEQPTVINFKKIPIIGSDISRLESSVQEHGLKLTIQGVFERMGIVPVAHYISPDSQTILDTQPVLLVGTHPIPLEAAAIAATLPNREDIFVLGTYHLLGLDSLVKDHLIPIFGIERQDTKVKRTKLWRKFGFSPPPISQLEAAKNNIQSLQLASQKMREGGIVTIFPEGSREEGGVVHRSRISCESTPLKSRNSRYFYLRRRRF